jgi:mannose-6-phosphate isomerase-like protein (cupin superfamily)
MEKPTQNSGFNMNGTTAAPKPNELGFKTTYQLFLEKEGLPVIRAFHIEDIRDVELAPWNRLGGRGAYLNLEGTEGVNDCYIGEIPPGKSLNPQKKMFEELVFVVSGRGATTVWRDEKKKQTFEWQEGSLFSPPLNTWHQHFNGQGDKPVRLLAMTNAPTVLNLFHNTDFVFNCDYPFTDRYNGEEDYFSGNTKSLSEHFRETNFIRDVRSFELIERKERGAGGKMTLLEMGNNVMSAHISQFPVGTYKKAHRHGAGAHVIILKGEGFSLTWPEDQEIKRYDWRAGSLLVPPERWFHQHFNLGNEPARYLALKPFSSRKFPGLRKQWETSESVKRGGDQIEYDDEDPRVRKMFEEELARRGVKSGMDEVLRGTAAA